LGDAVLLTHSHRFAGDSIGELSRRINGGDVSGPICFKEDRSDLRWNAQPN
jgi:hypothetical protein